MKQLTGNFKRSFICPICHESVETINDYLARGTIDLQLEIGLKNKRFHMVRHKEDNKEEKKRLRKLARTTLVDGTG